jgi:transposase
MASDPKDLPPRSTVHDYFDLWAWDGTLDRIHHALYVQCRELASRELSPSAAIIDSQSVKSAEKGGLRQSTWRSSSAPISQRALRSCPSDRSSNAPSHGSTAAAA